MVGIKLISPLPTHIFGSYICKILYDTNVAIVTQEPKYETILDEKSIQNRDPRTG